MNQRALMACHLLQPRCTGLQFLVLPGVKDRESDTPAELDAEAQIHVGKMSARFRMGEDRRTERRPVSGKRNPHR